jgi:SPP1 gp7 family putative phage head morphogenesis protein
VITSDLLLRYRIPKRSRAKARREAPNPPTAPGLLYLRDLMRLRRTWRAHVLEELAPVLREFAGERQDMTLMPPSLWRKIAQLKTEAMSVFTSERVTTFLRGVGLRTAEHARKEVSRVIGVPLKSVIDEGRLASFQRQNVELITKMTAEELDSIGETVAEAATKGLRVEALAERVQERFGVSDSRAALIARDQTLKLNSHIASDRMQAVGVKTYVWVASRDERVRDSHAALDGQTFAFSDPPVTDERTGARNNPGQDFQCRCTASPIVDDLF